jgi:hypothetical protein
MYVAHFAAGLAIKAREPRAPTWALLVGVGLLDILFGPFVLAGIERATVTPTVSPGFSLDYIDWSHSLVMSLGWSFVLASVFARHGRRVMIAIGFAVCDEPNPRCTDPLGQSARSGGCTVRSSNKCEKPPPPRSAEHRVRRPAASTRPSGRRCPRR